MKTYKTILKQYESEVLDSLTCDICGKTTNRDNWSDKDFNVNKVTIKLEQGNRYPPDCENGEDITVDICPDCFMTRLVPFFKTFEADIQIKEW